MEKSRQKFSLTREEINTILGIAELILKTDLMSAVIKNGSVQMMMSVVLVRRTTHLWALRCLTLPETFEGFRASLDIHIRFPVPQDFV